MNNMCKINVSYLKFFFPQNLYICWPCHNEVIDLEV